VTCHPIAGHGYTRMAHQASVLRRIRATTPLGVRQVHAGPLHGSISTTTGSRPRRKSSRAKNTGSYSTVTLHFQITIGEATWVPFRGYLTTRNICHINSEVGLQQKPSKWSLELFCKFIYLLMSTFILIFVLDFKGPTPSITC
jgi:hypothetical protein